MSSERADASGVLVYVFLLGWRSARREKLFREATSFLKKNRKLSSEKGVVYAKYTRSVPGLMKFMGAAPSNLERARSCFPGSVEAKLPSGVKTYVAVFFSGRNKNVRRSLEELLPALCCDWETFVLDRNEGFRSFTFTLGYESASLVRVTVTADSGALLQKTDVNSAAGVPQ